MSNGQNIIRRLHGAADIALRSGEHLLIGRPAVFGAEFREMIEGHKPALTERVILNIQDYASHGMGRLHGVLADYDGWGGLPLSASGISQRVAGLVRRGSLLALIIPAVTLNDMTTDSAQLEAMSADLARQEGVNPELSVEGKTFADLNGMTDKLVYVIKSSGQYFSFESVKTAFTSAMTVTAIISVAVVLAAWAASHFAGIGFAIDAVLIAIGWIMLGWAIFSAMRSLLKCLKLIHHAESLEDLDKAAKMFADAVTQFGVDVIIGLLTRGAGKMRAKASAKPGAGSKADTPQKTKADIEAENRTKSQVKTRSETQQDIVDKMGKDLKGNPLRKDYEDEVSALSRYKDRISPDMTNAELEKLAKEASQARRDLGVKYKDVTPSPLKDYIYDVNKARYDDPLGPTLDWFKRENNLKGIDKLTDRQLYEKIIGGASRPNPDVDKLLGGFNDWLSKKPDSFIMKFGGGV